MSKRPYTMQRRAELAAETRERLVRATVALHAEKGPLATTYAMIAERAQVSPQTVYNHFPDPGTLFGACTDHVLGRAPPLGPDSYRPGRSPAARLRLLAETVYARQERLAPWSRHESHAAALIPALHDILARRDSRLRDLIADAVTPERVASPEFVDAAFVLLDYPAWRLFTEGRSGADAARIAGDCLTALLPVLTHPKPKGKP